MGVRSISCDECVVTSECLNDDSLIAEYEIIIPIAGAFDLCECDCATVTEAEVFDSVRRVAPAADSDDVAELIEGLAVFSDCDLQIVAAAHHTGDQIIRSDTVSEEEGIGSRRVADTIFSISATEAIRIITDSALKNIRSCSAL